MVPREPRLTGEGAAWRAPAPYAGPAAPGPDGMDFFRKLWRSKLLILAAAGLGALAAAGVASTIEPRYSAESRVLIGAERPKVAEIPEVLQQLTASQEVVQSESYVLQSRSLAAQVAERLALDRDPEFNPSLRPPPPAWKQWIGEAKGLVKSGVKSLLGAEEEAAPAAGPSAAERREREREIVVSSLLGRVEVSPLQRSHVLAIQAQSQNPRTAARIANGLADSYVEQQLVRRVTANEQASQWLDERVEELRAKVQASERAVEEYRRDNGLFETRNDAVTAQQVSELNSQVIVAESELAQAESRLSQARQVAGGGAPAEALPEVLASPLIQGLKQQQTEVQRKVAELGSTYGPQHPRMRDARAELADVQGKLGLEVGRIVEGLRNEAEAQRARTEALRRNLVALKSDMGEVNEQSIQLRELERQAEANRRLLVSFLDRAKELAAPQPDADQASALVISRAAVPLAPSFPPTTLLVLLGAIGGTLIGALVGLVRENLDRSFRTAQQLESATSLPVLAVLPSPDGSRFAGVRQARHSRSPFAHAASNLFERLAFAPGSRSHKVIMLTSATPREGKSRIASTLMRMATGSGLRVIVLDCDWRRPVLHDHLRQAVEPGLGELLAGNAPADEVVFHDPESGGHAIFAGDVSQISDGHLRYERLRLLLTTLSRHYDLVLLDTPPVLAGPEAQILASMADEVAFVVRWGKAPRDAIAEALAHLDMAGARLGGTILSGVDRRRYRGYGTGDAMYAYPYGRAVTRAA